VRQHAHARMVRRRRARPCRTAHRGPLYTDPLRHPLAAETARVTPTLLVRLRKVFVPVRVLTTVVTNGRRYAVKRAETDHLLQRKTVRAPGADIRESCSLFARPGTEQVPTPTTELGRCTPTAAKLPRETPYT
jgi:hypothetical protein